MSEKPKLNLIFLTFLVGGNKINSYRLSFDPNLYFIHNSEEAHKIPEEAFKAHEISEEVFKFGKDKAIIYITFYDSNGNNLATVKYPIYYCPINTIYIEENYIKNGYNIEIDFKYSNDLSIKINDKEIKILDTIETKDRKKITLINFNTLRISANQEDINIIPEIEKCNVKSPINFYRLSINMKDPEMKKIVQPIKEMSSPKMHLQKETKIILDEFYKNINELLNIKNNHNYTKKYECILKKYNKKIQNVEYELNKSMDYLEQYFGEHPIDMEIILEYEIFCLLRDGEHKYMKNQELFKNIVKGMIQFFIIKIKKNQI